MTLRERREIFTQNVAKLIERSVGLGCTVTLGEVMRTQEQADLYAAQGIGSKNSLHCKGLAVDLNAFRDGVYLRHTRDYKPLGDFWEFLHPDNKWGGWFDDGNHFEMGERKR